MCTDDLAGVIENLIDILGDAVRPAGHTDHKICEINLGNSFDAWCPDKNARLPIRTGSKSQLLESCALSTLRLVEFRIQAEVCQSKFVHSIGTKSFRVPEIYTVCGTSAKHAKSRIQRRVGRPIRVRTAVAIVIIVACQETPASVRVPSHAEFV